MRETDKAQQAWTDYLKMGPERSLEKLAGEYQKRTGNVPTRQLSRLKEWSQVHGWQARLSAIAERERAAIVARGIADKQNRIDGYNDRWGRMKQVIAERSEHNLGHEFPGWETGLLVREVKYLPGGTTVERFEVDTGLLKSMLDVEKQTAIELGQWSERKEVTGKDGGPIVVRTVTAEIPVEVAEE